jgi:hydroxymethylbilane synthase
VQLRAERPDLVVEPIRGNVETRLAKLRDTPYDALVMAVAGLRRLGLEPPGLHVLEPEVMIPAVGQGTLGIETRDADEGTRRLAEGLDDAGTRAAAEAERAFLAAIRGSCTTPLGAYARREGGRFRLSAFVATPDGSRLLREVADLAEGTPAELGRRVADRMLAAGAAEIIRAGTLR